MEQEDAPLSPKSEVDDHTAMETDMNPAHTKKRKEGYTKTSISIALQDANTAVVLDNAQKCEGTVQAYMKACKKRQVRLRSTSEDEKQKLHALVSSNVYPIIYQ